MDFNAALAKIDLLRSLDMARNLVERHYGITLLVRPHKNRDVHVLPCSASAECTKDELGKADESLKDPTQEANQIGQRVENRRNNSAYHVDDPLEDDRNDPLDNRLKEDLDPALPLIAAQAELLAFLLLALFLGFLDALSTAARNCAFSAAKSAHSPGDEPRASGPPGGGRRGGKRDARRHGAAG